MPTCLRRSPHAGTPPTYSPTTPYYFNGGLSRSVRSRRFTPVALTVACRGCQFRTTTRVCPPLKHECYPRHFAQGSFSSAFTPRNSPSCAYEFFYPLMPAASRPALLVLRPDSTSFEMRPLLTFLLRLRTMLHALSGTLSLHRVSTCAHACQRSTTSRSLRHSAFSWTTSSQNSLPFATGPAERPGDKPRSIS